MTELKARSNCGKAVLPDDYGKLFAILSNLNRPLAFWVRQQNVVYAHMPPVTKNREETPGNKLLAALPSADFKALEKHLEICTLEKGDVLWEMDELREHVYFPIDCIICLLHESENGVSVEVGMTGRQGMVGVVTFIGDGIMAKRAVVQNAGRAYRVAAEVVEKRIADSVAFHDVCMSYTQVLLAELSQNAICNRLHSVDQQVSRYLLRSYESLGTHKFSVTHQQMADSLGVRRESISVAAQGLRDQGLIEYARGEVKLLDRAGLTAVTCECYEAVHDQYKRILKDYVSEHEH